MKSPSAESSLKFAHAVECLLQCPELRGDDVSEATHQLIDTVLETAAQVKRESKFPARADVVAYFARRLAEEDREVLVKRIVALVSTFSNEELYASYEEALEKDAGKAPGES